MNVNTLSHEPEQNNDTNINQLVSSIMANPRLSDSNREEVLEVLKKYNLDKLDTQKNTVIDLLNLKISVEAKIRVNKLITKYRRDTKLHTKEINSLFNNTIIVKRPTTLKEMDIFEEAMKNVLKPKEVPKEITKQKKQVIKNAPLSPDKEMSEKRSVHTATILKLKQSREFKREVKKVEKVIPKLPKKNEIEENDDGLGDFMDKYSSRDQVLFSMIETYLVYEKSEKNYIEKDENGWDTNDLKNNKNLTENGKKELKRLLKLTKDLDIDNGEIGIIGGDPILEIDTTGSNVILSINDNGDVIISGQKSGELFSEKISYTELLKGKEELNNLINNYQNKSKIEIIEDAIGIGAITLAGSLIFFLKTGLSMAISGLGFIFTAHKGYEMYNKNNLERNDSILLAKELKEDQSYENYKNIMKPYVYGAEIGFIDSYSESDGKYIFTTVDGNDIKEEYLGKTMEKLFWNNSNDKRIENKNISNKYKLLKNLDYSTISFDYISEGKYDLDFTGLGDDTSLVFKGDKVTLITDEIDAVFEYNILDETTFTQIAMVDKYLQEKQTLYHLEQNAEEDENSFMSSSSEEDIEEQKVLIRKMKKEIMKNNVKKKI